jgi:hypothetical protein
MEVEDLVQLQNLLDKLVLRHHVELLLKPLQLLFDAFLSELDESGAWEDT